MDSPLCPADQKEITDGDWMSFKCLAAVIQRKTTYGNKVAFLVNSFSKSGLLLKQYTLGTMFCFVVVVVFLLSDWLNLIHVFVK